MMWIPIEKSSLPDEHDQYGKDHLKNMLTQLELGTISGEKAHRWIGWIQGCVCVGGGATLEDMKMINKMS